jgi:hypothetical protein
MASDLTERTAELARARALQDMIRQGVIREVRLIGPTMLPDGKCSKVREIWVGPHKFQNPTTFPSEKLMADITLALMAGQGSLK